MLSWKEELMPRSASTSFLAFCVCHLIVAILLLISSSNGVTERSLPTIDDDDRVRGPAPSTSGFGGPDEKNGDDSNGEDDELRKRAEEFIEKMNSVWRAERKKMLR
ncbi:unnamed protein product [Musa banksii]